jgi:hypothetical protein
MVMDFNGYGLICDRNCLIFVFTTISALAVGTVEPHRWGQ